MNTAENRALYLAWLRENYPELYDASVPGNTATGVTAPSLANEPTSYSIGGFWDSVGTAFTDTVKNVTQALPALATSYGAYRTQSELIKLNTTRAAQGLAPLVPNASGQLVPYGGSYTDSELRLAQTGMSTSNLLMIGLGFGLLLILVLKK